MKKHEEPFNPVVIILLGLLLGVTILAIAFHSELKDTKEAITQCQADKEVKVCNNYHLIYQGHRKTTYVPSMGFAENTSWTWNVEYDKVANITVFRLTQNCEVVQDD